jgi:hypothetical protein
MNGLQSADQENCNEDEGLGIEVYFLLPAERVAEPAPPTRSTKLKVLDIRAPRFLPVFSAAARRNGAPEARPI